MSQHNSPSRDTRCMARNDRHNKSKWALVTGCVLLLGGLSAAGWWVGTGNARSLRQVASWDGSHDDRIESVRRLIDQSISGQADAPRLRTGVEHPETHGRGDEPIDYDEQLRREIGEYGIRMMTRFVEVYNTPGITEAQQRLFRQTLLDAAAVAREDGNILEWAIPTTMVGQVDLLYDIDVDATIDRLIAIAREPAVPPTLRLNSLEYITGSLVSRIKSSQGFDPTIAQRALEAIDMSLDLIDRIDPELDRFLVDYTLSWKRRGDVLAAMRDIEGATGAWLTLVDGPHARLVSPQTRAEAYKNLADHAVNTGDYAAATRHIEQAIERIPRESAAREFPILLETLRFQERHGVQTVDAMPNQAAELIEFWRREDLARYPSHLQIGTHTARVLQSVDPAEALIVYEEVIERGQQLLDSSLPGSAERMLAQHIISHATRERIIFYAGTPNHFVADILPLEIMRAEAIDYLNRHPDLQDWELRLLEDNIIFKEP